MRAMVYRGGRLAVQAVERPVPGPMQVLAKVRACGVCGSDLHAVQGGGLPDGVVLGHEFVAEIVEAGPGGEGWPRGMRVVGSPTMPAPDLVAMLARRAGPDGPPASVNLFLTPGSQTIGYSPRYPGGFGEYVVLSAPLLVPVPDHVTDTAAATTEPGAVSLHAVRAARIQPGEHALVMGAGPIGLMTLLWLRRAGVAHITVTERAAPRRELAARLGADLVLDPAVDGLGERLAAAKGPPPVVFECAGVPGTLQQAMDLVAREGRVVVVGVCSTADQIQPRIGITKHVTLQFVLAYTAVEIAEALDAIADGSIDPSPLITRTVSLDELPDVFPALSDPRECKVLLRFPPA